MMTDKLSTEVEKFGEQFESGERSELQARDYLWQELPPKIAALEQRVEGLDEALSMFQGFSVSELLRVIAKDYDRSDVGNSVKMRRAMWLKDLADKLDALAEDNLDNLPTQQKPTEEAMEEA